MSDYNIFPAVNRDLEFPPSIRAKLADAEELKKVYAHLEDGKLVIDGKVVAAAAGTGTGTGTAYSDATAATSGVVKLATESNVNLGTTGALAVSASLLKTLLAMKATIEGIGKTFWSGTQADYDLITTKSATTLYFVVTAGS